MHQHALCDTKMLAQTSSFAPLLGPAGPEFGPLTSNPFALHAASSSCPPSSSSSLAAVAAATAAAVAEQRQRAAAAAMNLAHSVFGLGPASSSNMRNALRQSFATGSSATSPFLTAFAAAATNSSGQQIPATSYLVGEQPSALDQHSHRLHAMAAMAATGSQASIHQRDVSVSSRGHCLFVYNLAPESDESSLWKLFGPFGAVQQVNLVKDPQTDKCKGFAFVTMSDYNQALMAIQSLNGAMLANRVLQVSFKTLSKVRRTMAAPSSSSSPATSSAVAASSHSADSRID